MSGKHRLVQSVHGVMLLLHDPLKEIAAQLARLSSVLKSSEQAKARAERAPSDAFAA